ncbi:hypothetical protein PS645_05105 [Pseudomonas fluorescens]|uniref:Uncharacterized protein n=1 Tax=Pseudomonas fluorescens TaxID=294 RepID=A0A5E6X5R0_PSEFL|nr:hypothetical protein PS645_05105 [Pseudomonas fluorescens]
MMDLQRDRDDASHGDRAINGTRLLSNRAAISTHLLGVGLPPFPMLQNVAGVPQAQQVDRGISYRVSLFVMADFYSTHISWLEILQALAKAWVGHSVSGAIVSCCAVRAAVARLREVLGRIDTLNEVEYFKSGGILHYVLRQLIAS